MRHKRIRVLYTIPNFNTAGSGKSVYDLVNRLDRRVFDPEICCFHDEGAFFEDIKALGVPIHLFPFTTSYTPRLGFLSRVLKIRAFFKSHKFDIIHSWHWSSDISEPLAAKLAGVPYVYTKKAMGWKSRFWKIRSQLSSKVIVVNQDMMTAYFSNMMHKAVQFPLAIDVERYQPSLGSEPLKQQLGLSSDDFVIISVANLVEVKGIETLLEAVNQLHNSKIKVLVVGGDSSEYAIALKSKYKTYSHINFIGKQLDVRPYLALSDLFVIPTKDEGRREGIPNAPLEAMSMKRIVLGSDISGVRDILKVFPDCMFKADDIASLKRKIETVMNLPESDRMKLEENMRKRVVEEFSIEDFIERHQVLYQKLVKN
jgi:glycosyltransferase involved in cell wall biosynthesis